MLRSACHVKWALVLLTTTLTGLAFGLPIRYDCACTSYRSSLWKQNSYDYLTDWLQGHPGLMLMISLIVVVSVLLTFMLALGNGVISGQVQNFLYLQAAVSGLATLGLLLLTDFGHASTDSVYLTGYNALIALGMWASLGSWLYASGRLDRWLVSA